MNKNETDIKSLGNIAKVMEENNNINKSMRNKIEELIGEIKSTNNFHKKLLKKMDENGEETKSLIKIINEKDEETKK